MLAVYKRFIREAHGNIALMTAVLLPVFLILVGAMIDFGRAQIVRSHTLGAMDAAALAFILSDSTLSTLEREELRRGFYEANKGSGVPEADAVQYEDLTFTLENGQLNVTHGNKIKSSPLLASGSLPQINVGASVGISTENSAATELELDLCFVLDRSGSMEGDKWSSLVLAVREFSDSLFPPTAAPDTIDPRMRICVVYYDATSGDAENPTLPLEEVLGTIQGDGRPKFYHHVSNTQTDSGTCGSCGLKEVVNVFMKPTPRKIDGLSSNQKVVVFLTDGSFNHPKGQGDEFPFSSARAECDKLKTLGVSVITIQYGGGSKQQTRDVLQYCATPDANGNLQYYPDVYEGQLADLFKSIAETTSMLRITR